MLKNLKNFNLPAIEEKILEFWKKNRIFEKSVNNRRSQKQKPFRFFEGPPTANGRPGTHHILSRSFKDIIPRYKTMRGFYVSRRAGWDTHGLPVEIEVEKELGIREKSEIEKLGIAEFNTKARTSVWKYKSDWEKLTERIGFWLDFANPYVTYDNSYIETLWWIFRKISDQGLLKKMHRVVPWCPRCQTPLSNNELGQPDVYRKTKDPSVYVKFRIKKNEYLLVWTTTPWTLPANVAVAVDPKLTYTKFKVGKDFFWSYVIPPKSDGVEISIIEKIAGAKLVGKKYEPLYKAKGGKSHYQVWAGDFISTEEGTGLVHIAPAFGEDDLKLAFKEKFPSDLIPITVDGRGLVDKGLPGAGKFIKDADRDIVEDLKKRDLLYQEGVIEHEYPFCWRCSTPLIYFARLSWFIEMSRLKNELIRANEKINWIPAHLKEGRFGDWLSEGKDWSISRERFWGTPLPIWECEKCEEHFVAGSYDDLNSRAYYRNRFSIARHGEAEHNVKDIFAMVPETARNVSKLTEKGIKQAKALGERLKKEKINLIYASPFLRTKETARIISRIAKAKVVFDKRLGEINGGIFGGRKTQDYRDFFSNLSERFTKRPEGGEHLIDVKKRIISFFKEINSKHNGKNIAVISHADPLWAIEASSKGFKNEEFGKSPSLDFGECRELKFPNWPFNNVGVLDWHRPFIDEIYLECGVCGGRMERIKEVADVWFDSGAMPFAEWHYPFENKELINLKKQFPADYIAEGVDQTRGWFYTLLAISILLKMGAPYKNVISLGLLLDKNGQKMSKSKGNVVDPWEMIGKYGADVLRWYFFTVNDPGDPKKFDEADLLKVYRRFHLLFYNSFVFFETYAGNVKNFSRLQFKAKTLIDRWITARLHETISSVTKKLDDYEIGQAARTLESFMDDLSHWYIRRSRKRFSDSDNRQDFLSAAGTLRNVLLGLSRLSAPFSPFISEAIYLSLKLPVFEKADSVHLDDWPVPNKELIDQKLLRAVAEARRISSLGLALRSEAGIKVRQPLTALKVRSKTLKAAKNHELLNMIAEELNVKEVIFSDSIKSEVRLDTEITPELYKEGMLRELSRLIQKVRQDSGYRVTDSVYLYLAVSEETRSALENKLSDLKRLVKAKKIQFTTAEDENFKKCEAKAETKLGESPIIIGLRRL
ncbi:MAG TPA: class I tRNA ligase family protein [Candidatus Paceibacterota bacterium]